MFLPTAVWQRPCRYARTRTFFDDLRIVAGGWLVPVVVLAVVGVGCETSSTDTTSDDPGESTHAGSSESEKSPDGATPVVFRLVNDSGRSFDVQTSGCHADPGWVEFEVNVGSCGLCECRMLDDGGTCPTCKCAKTRWKNVEPGDTVEWTWNGVYYERIERDAKRNCFRKRRPQPSTMTVEFCRAPGGPASPRGGPPPTTCVTESFEYGETTEVRHVVD